MLHTRTATRRWGMAAVTLFLALAVAACGGGSGGAGPGGAGQGLVLVGFLQAGVDNLPINSTLEFSFSEPVDPTTVNAGTIQIRQGPDFGATAKGSFRVAGEKVFFEPVLPTDCALLTAGLQPGTAYRITVVGFPEEFCVKNSKGQPLDRTSNYTFTTLPETSDDVLQDQKPGQAPTVLSTLPASGVAAATVEQGNEVVIEFSENIDPCSINTDTVSCAVYETGDSATYEAAPNGNMSGFVPVEDSAPGDPYSWGAGNSTAKVPPQVVPVERVLEQTADSTRLYLRPNFGEFPDNALIVVQLTFGVTDFGGQSLPPTTIAFTTENRQAQVGTFSIHFDATTPVEVAGTTADINTARSPHRAQAWLLFAGDGDNGGATLTANLKPAYPNVIDTDCTFRPNSGLKTPFEPSTDVNLDTGSSRNQACVNLTDGSKAVVWEFSTFKIKSGVTVRIVGENPAIILVQGDVLIENGGVLRVRGDAGNGAPDGRGTQGKGYYYNGSYGNPAHFGYGGEGIAGGGDGGDGADTFPSDSSYYVTNGPATSDAADRIGKDGFVGYGSPDFNKPEEQGGQGAGEGNIGATIPYPNYAYGIGNAPAGGGGGHGTDGEDGKGQPSGNVTNDSATLKGHGGGTYPAGDAGTKMYTPSAGSGGGGGGELFMAGYTSSYWYAYLHGASGGGGAGGGFVDITSGGNIRIFGTIDAMGSRGGDGATAYSYSAGSGGGGGSGGGIRLLTPNDIDIAGGTLTTSGGQGGLGADPSSYSTYYTPTPFYRNDGGAGGMGRIVLEDEDSIIDGYQSATVIPGEGQDGFYRGPFTATRFQGGGLNPVAVTGLMLLGPVTAPTFQANVLGDFLLGIPAGTGPGPGKTSMLMEVQGFPMKPDGTADDTAPTGWYTVGYIANAVTGPQWYSNANPGDVMLPPDNLGAGISNIDGSQYIQVRISFWLPDTITATQPGPFVDNWTIRFQYDN